MASKNDITKRPASIRELFTMPLVEKYDNLFKDSGTDFVVIETMITSGLYLSLSTQRSFRILQYLINTEEGRHRINESIKFLSEPLFNRK